MRNNSYNRRSRIIQLALILFVFLFETNNIFAAGFAFRLGPIGRVYTSSDQLFNQQPTQFVHSLDNQPAANDQLIRPYEIPFIITYQRSQIEKTCNATVIGNNLVNGVLQANQVWMLSAADCLNNTIILRRATAWGNQLVNTMHFPRDFSPNPAINDFFYVITFWPSFMPLISYGVGVFPFLQTAPIMPEFSEVIGARQYSPDGRLVLFLLQQTNAFPTLILPSNLTTYHLQDGHLPNYERLIASWGYLTTVASNGSIVSQENRTPSGFLLSKLNKTYIDAPSAKFKHEMEMNTGKEISQYLSYACYGDSGAAILQNEDDPTIATPRTVLSGVVVEGLAVASGKCINVGGTHLYTSLLHEFNQTDIAWILNTTGLTNRP